MGLLGRSLTMLVLGMMFFWLTGLRAQSTNGSSGSSARALDALLQDYAYRALSRPKTGTSYGGVVPSNLTGINITAMRLRSGSLWRHGVNMYNEFVIPTGVTEKPYVERLVLVYQNLGNWSMQYYPLTGYTYLAPVLGLLAYNASNLKATNLPELDIRASRDPISIRFSDVKSAPDGSVPKCVWFDLQGLANFSNVASGNVCTTIQQGHFSIVVESVAPVPPPVSPVVPPPPPISPPPSRGGRKTSTKVGIIVGSVLGGLLLLALLAILVVWAQKYKEKRKMHEMEKAADVGEALQMTSVGETKAPSATGTRTQPMLENEYVP
ncbi:hypothetical protein SLEP1_g16464 [Rubroshorea leprosula]|uniref:Uncharacterized protein n=1 Tax=Rubroshorea leprosula TaxID=152421 RepID=A0AAV5J073_9ROSI|nr:hypothetical protein SLEP1_g16464 [Rubroshorea leprosula]